MEESKTNTPEIWFSAGRKMTVYAALEDTGCDDELAPNVKTFTQARPPSHTHTDADTRTDADTHTCRHTEPHTS